MALGVHLLHLPVEKMAQVGLWLKFGPAASARTILLAPATQMLLIHTRSSAVRWSHTAFSGDIGSLATRCCNERCCVGQGLRVQHRPRWQFAAEWLSIGLGPRLHKLLIFVEFESRQFLIKDAAFWWLMTIIVDMAARSSCLAVVGDLLGAFGALSLFPSRLRRFSYGNHTS